MASKGVTPDIKRSQNYENDNDYAYVVTLCLLYWHKSGAAT